MHGELFALSESERDEKGKGAKEEVEILKEGVEKEEVGKQRQDHSQAREAGAAAGRNEKAGEGQWWRERVS